MGGYRGLFVFLPIGFLVFFALPAAAKHAVGEVIATCFGAATGVAGSAFGFLEGYMEARRKSSEAISAKKAAAQARELEAEMASTERAQPMQTSPERAGAKAKGQKDPDAWKAAGKKKKGR